jgi:hypothetical protein
MVKMNRKPAGQPKAATPRQTGLRSPSNRSHDKPNELAANASSGWRHRLHELWVEVLAAAILGSGNVGLGLLWLGGCGEHESTKAQLARAEDEKQQAIGERTRLQKNLASLQKDNADIMKLHPD